MKTLAAAADFMLAAPDAMKAMVVYSECQGLVLNVIDLKFQPCPPPPLPMRGVVAVSMVSQFLK